MLAPFAKPLFLVGVDVQDYPPVFGARVANQEAAFPAVMPPLGLGEPCEAAHAPFGNLIWDPSNCEGVAGPRGGALQYVGLAALNVCDPGLFLFHGSRRHEEGLDWRADQPLVSHVATILQVLQLNVLLRDSKSQNFRLKPQNDDTGSKMKANSSVSVIQEFSTGGVLKRQTNSLPYRRAAA